MELGSSSAVTTAPIATQDQRSSTGALHRGTSWRFQLYNTDGGGSGHVTQSITRESELRNGKSEFRLETLRTTISTESLFEIHAISAEPRRLC